MKRITTVIALFIFAFTFISAAESLASDYDAFSKNLVKALQSDNKGLQVSALQMVIKHGKKVNVDAATLDIVRIYRRSADEQFRRLALAAIHASQNEWAINVVVRDYRFETNPRIKKMMAAVIRANNKADVLSVSAQ